MESVTKSFGGLRAVDNVTLSLMANRITGLIGPNGSGKTTLFNLISGTYKPDSGRILFNGIDITGLKPHEINRLGIVRSFQFPKAFYKMTLLDNLIFAAPNQVGDNPVIPIIARRRIVKQEEELREKAFKTLELVGLMDYAYNFPSQLSGGQLKLLELARALIPEPKLLLLDEPAAGVSPLLIPQIFSTIRSVVEESSLTVFVIEHRLNLIAEYVDWIYAMHRGQVFLSGRPHEVLEDERLLAIYVGEGAKV